MANHSPRQDIYPLSKTWDEAMDGENASGAAELPEGYVKQVPPVSDGSVTPATIRTDDGTP